MDKKIIKEKMLERFKRYVAIDTQSDPASSTYPSTKTQKDFAQKLLKELKEIGVKNSFMDKYSYVFGKIDSNCGSRRKIAFIAHMDTAPAYSGKNVKVKIHKNYRGGKINVGNGIYIDEKNCPPLSDHIGDDILTASGYSLLGADNKAGIAIIMTLAEYILKNKEKIKYPNFRILFTPDEEIGKGVEKLDLKKLDAEFGYTLDGDLKGTIEKETFNADGVSIEVKGKSVHPGSAKNQMANAVRIISDIISSWPENMTPENTENYDGFIMFDEIKGDVSYAKASGIVREHDIKKLKYMENLLLKIVEEKRHKYPLADIKLEFKEQYRNMKEVIDKYPEVMEKLISSIKDVGIDYKIKPVRGGTDGSRLSFMGLPTPNIFTGGYNYHGPYEWISLDSMLKSFEVSLKLLEKWTE
ncbi:MAG: peptidase T [Elusimicrobiota bacterium]